jgi:hypothetical protein
MRGWRIEKFWNSILFLLGASFSQVFLRTLDLLPSLGSKFKEFIECNPTHAPAGRTL